MTEYNYRIVCSELSYDNNFLTLNVDHTKIPQAFFQAVMELVLNYLALLLAKAQALKNWITMLEAGGAVDE